MASHDFEAAALLKPLTEVTDELRRLMGFETELAILGVQPRLANAAQTTIKGKATFVINGPCWCAGR